MFCCTECFNDNEIRTMIFKEDVLGECIFCGKDNVNIFPVNQETDLSNLISDVIEMYEPSTDGDLLFDQIINDWNIFNRSLPSASKLLQSFCSTIYGDSISQYNKPVQIKRNSIRDYGVFSGLTWTEFSTAIKNTNRFHNPFFRADQFATFLTFATKKYRKETNLYRARLWPNNQGLNTTDMGAPPIGKRKAGRVNPEGISVLYLTSDEKTALSEVRASAFDRISIGVFQLQKDINVVNISDLKNISPALYTSGLEALTANIKVFKDIAEEIAKPLRRNDSPLEYLPTQYITEYIKSKGYAGVEYQSTMTSDGFNIAVFNESLFECHRVYDIEMEQLKYTYREYAG